MINRRVFISSAAALAACGPKLVAPREPKKLIAVTMDDFHIESDVMMPRRDRNAAILAAFAAHNHKAAGFVTGENVDSAFGHETVQSWAEAGHLIGNHTWSHMNSSETDAQTIEADILKNHAFLSQYEGYEPIFRFPYLAEGGTPEKVAHYRSFMEKNGFSNAPVTIDSMDWFVTGRMEARLKENAKADVQGYRNYYVQAIMDIAEQKHQLALRLGYTDLPHTLLVHHNVLNGMFLADVMRALAADGWSFVDARAAFKHPLYALKPKTPNRGRSVLSVLAQEAGTAPNFPEKYKGFGKAEMERLGL